MKILAFNSSPRKSQGVTDLLLDHFLDAAIEAGATATKHYVVDLNINGCKGCFTCWTKNPGKCIHRDDMDRIIPEVGEADIIILATPVYNGNVTHYQQRMMERFLPTVLPWQVEQGETTAHPERYDRKRPIMVLIATAGFPDHQAFDIPKALYPQSVTITLPAAQILAYRETAKHVKDFTDAVAEVAQQLVNGGTPSPELVERLNIKYSSEMKEMVRNQANRFFEARILES